MKKFLFAGFLFAALTIPAVSSAAADMTLLLDRDDANNKWLAWYICLQPRAAPNEQVKWISPASPGGNYYIKHPNSAMIVQRISVDQIRPGMTNVLAGNNLQCSGPQFSSGPYTTGYGFRGTITSVDTVEDQVCSRDGCYTEPKYTFKIRIDNATFQPQAWSTDRESFTPVSLTPGRIIELVFKNSDWQSAPSRDWPWMVKDLQVINYSNENGHTLPTPTDLSLLRAGVSAEFFTTYLKEETGKPPSGKPLVINIASARTDAAGNPRGATPPSSATRGTITVNATLDGNPWSGMFKISYKYPLGEGTTDWTVPQTVPNNPLGSYTVGYISGGPADAILAAILGGNCNNTRPCTQELTANSPLTFTFAFQSPQGQQGSNTTGEPDTTGILSPEERIKELEEYVRKLTEKLENLIRQQQDQSGTQSQTGGSSGVAGQAQAISIGAHVITTDRLNVRAFGSLSAGVLGVQPANTPGVVVGGPVRSNDLTWWNVDYEGGIDGWSADRWLRVLMIDNTNQSRTGGRSGGTGSTGGSTGSQTQAGGTIRVRATLDGQSWNGTINTTYSLNGGPCTTASANTQDYPGTATGTYTVNCNLHNLPTGPAGAILRDITPSATQTLFSGRAIIFTFNFISGQQTGGSGTTGQAQAGTGTIHLSADYELKPWRGTISVRANNGPCVGVSVPSTHQNVPAGTYTIGYCSGGPGKFISISPYFSRTLLSDSEISFHFNFRAKETDE